LRTEARRQDSRDKKERDARHQDPGDKKEIETTIIEWEINKKN
jgi:hypothetical protein